MLNLGTCKPHKNTLKLYYDLSPVKPSELHDKIVEQSSVNFDRKLNSNIRLFLVIITRNVK